jgi:hypothetical protein
MGQFKKLIRLSFNQHFLQFQKNRSPVIALTKKKAKKERNMELKNFPRESNKHVHNNDKIQIVSE